MTIKKYSIHAPRDWLAWWLPVAMSVAGLSLVAASEAALPMRIGAAVTAAAFAGIFAVRMVQRIKFERSIVGYTDLGIGVIGGLSRERLDRSARRVAAFWSAALSVPVPLEMFNGLFVKTAETVTNTWSGPRREIGGMYVDGFITVKDGPGDTLAVVTSRLDHELSHFVLDRIVGRDTSGGDFHHKVFAQHGFPDV